MKIITVSSFKGGTAKTSISLNIGAVLAKQHQKKILLIDFDAQANLTAGLGFDPDEHDSLAPVLQGTKHVKDVILKTSIKNLDLIPADTWLERIEVSGSLASDRYSHEKLKSVLSSLHYDYVFIDTPPSLCWLTESAFIAAHYCLVAATPEFYSIKGLQRLSLFMDSIGKRHPLKVLGVALSFWNDRGKNNDAFLNIINETFPGKVLTYKIRKDVAVSEASIMGKPVIEAAPASRASQDYLHLTNELLMKM
jgi:chromosome partitioning protein